eukprot:Protomagalhaensia_sp_Gyna_25__118@NODE_1058_length_2237_cov_1383_824841_g843_i0_p2_GENE_NODE_1058_length_2237_cov_1383_824841_g843_i0NODE_1058_length_2237_cov_1383_824841_g843_i0_p2_ORF_typecomplete_len159_score18_51TolA_bind_tri/PF16331_5/0_0099Nup88/PF10168_9/0_017DUF3450/PF11932_8/0_02Laminin_II/PF06009_12/0_04COG6/PF06419_11/0_044Myosin_tail_1/PF01576_19/0_064AAA_13/PF13166_6/0_097NPV_P10/PF05531_12/0_41DMPK_coil/PF08826_10/0_46DUF3782/PF12644_7/0_24Atg14/PF10186_9/0_24HMMR_C/PF15908_5/1_2_N
MSFWQCAVGADREVKSSLDTLCLSEAETWSKLSTAMLTSESLKATKNVNCAKAAAQRRVDAIAEESERRNQLLLNLSKQLNEARESHSTLLHKVEALTKQLEVLEAQNLTLSKVGRITSIVTLFLSGEGRNHQGTSCRPKYSTQAVQGSSSKEDLTNG